MSIYCKDKSKLNYNSALEIIELSTNDFAEILAKGLNTNQNESIKGFRVFNSNGLVRATFMLKDFNDLNDFIKSLALTWHICMAIELIS